MDENENEEMGVVFLVIDEKGELISVQNENRKMTEEQYEMFVRVVTVHDPSFVLLFFLKIDILFNLISERILEITKEYFK